MVAKAAGDARVLGQLLLMQSVSVSLPDEAIIPFVVQGLCDIPGVAQVGYDAEPARDAGDAQRFSVAAGPSDYGELAFRLADAEAFAPYVDHIRNFSFMLALILEERRQRRTIESHQKHLEVEVAERTRQLSEQIEISRRTLAALSNSETLFRSLVDGAPFGIVLIGTDGRIAYLNSAFTAILGYTSEDIPDVAAWWPRAYPDPQYRQMVMEVWRQSVLDLQGPHQVRRSFTVRRRDGEDREIKFVVVHLPDLRILVTLEDITERKRAEAARAEAEAQLRESQKMEALGTLAGGVAHDFNNIITAIMGNADLVRQEIDPAHPARESLDEIGKASRRAKNLVQQILTFGRRHLPGRRATSLATPVQEAARLLRATLPAGVSLSVECDPDTPPVLADSTQIEQVLLNLCSNAWHAVQNQPRPGMIELRLQPQAIGDDRFACLTVRDNGRGIDETIRGRIFEPFFTTKPLGKGTGLGLAVVHGIVQEHGASIEVCSTAGEGTTFSIRFPAAKATLSAPPENAPTIGEQDGDVGPLAAAETRHVLYLDDDEAVLFLMKRLLERQGYRVSDYIDAAEALEAVRAQPFEFDLIVTDYNMPGMSGLDVAQALKEIRADLPVAVASGYITEELREKAPAHGVSELIHKPSSTEELSRIIARLVKAQRGRNPSA